MLWIRFLAKFSSRALYLEPEMTFKILLNEYFISLWKPSFLFIYFGVRRPLWALEPWIRIRIVALGKITIHNPRAGSTAYRGRLAAKIWKQKRRLSKLFNIFIPFFIFYCMAQIPESEFGKIVISNTGSKYKKFKRWDKCFHTFSH